MARFSVTRSGPRVEIAFDDGGVNVLSSSALRELSGIVEALIRSSRTESDEGSQPPRLLIFRSGHAHIFAAGADMAEMQHFTHLEAAEFARLGQETFRAIERLPMITVAIIDGDCFGGALDLILAFDLRYATARSRFSHPGGKLGIVTGFGGTSRWRKVMDQPAARSLFLGNPVFSAGEAAGIGLVDRVGDVEETELNRLASVDPATLQFVKELTIRTEALGQSSRLLVAERLGHIYFGELNEAHSRALPGRGIK